VGFRKSILLASQKLRHAKPHPRGLAELLLPRLKLGSAASAPAAGLPSRNAAAAAGFGLVRESRWKPASYSRGFHSPVVQRNVNRYSYVNRLSVWERDHMVDCASPRSYALDAARKRKSSAGAWKNSAAWHDTPVE
jgi:hypothetical protein